MAFVGDGRRILCLMPLPEGLVLRLVQIFGKCGVACLARWDPPACSAKVLSDDGK